MPNYPDMDRKGYSFGRAELELNRKIYTAVINVSVDQPTTEAAIMGTRPFPIGRTEGNMGLGEGTITFSDEEERVAFIDDLGDAYREVVWDMSWTLVSKGKPPINYAAFGCRILGNPVSHAQGDEALAGDVSFSCMYYTINGKVPHEGLPSVGR